MIWVAQLLIVFLLTPWLIHILLPSINTKVHKESTDNLHFMFLVLWIYNHLRSIMLFLDSIPMFSMFEMWFLCLGCLHAKYIRKQIQCYVIPCQEKVKSYWDSNKLFWEREKTKLC